MMKRTLLLLLCSLLVLGVMPGAPAQAQETDTWRGTISLPGMEMAFSVEFTLPAEADEESPVTATIDIPAQGAVGIPLQEVVYSDDELRFVITQAGAYFALKRDGDSAEGTLRQMGQNFPVTMRRSTPEEAEAMKPKRPQTPKPPFPYSQEEVTFTNPDDDTTLAGTLIVPEGDGPFPAVVFITGSGPQDRDETIFSHKPFFVIADHLARHGIASLRYDDRGVGGSGGSTMQSTAFDTAGDVMSAIELLQARPKINPDRIGLIGHSEGGIVAPIVAADNPSVDFLVLLAGTGLPGVEVLESQLRALLAASGVAGEELDRQIEIQQNALRKVIEGETLEEVRTAVEELLLAQSGLERNEDGSVPESIQPGVDAQTAALSSPWFQSFLVLDPRTYLKRVSQPVLALNGSLDFQVDPDLNLPEIRKALEEGGNQHFTVRELPGLNHLFQTAESGMLDEYSRIEETISPKVLEMITAWIRDRAKPAANSMSDQLP